MLNNSWFIFQLTNVKVKYCFMQLAPDFRFYTEALDKRQLQASILLSRYLTGSRVVCGWIGLIIPKREKALGSIAPIINAKLRFDNGCKAKCQVAM